MFTNRANPRSPRRRSALQIRPEVAAVERRVLLAAGHRPLVVATLGDSLTDEYQFYGPAAVAGLGGATLAALPANAAVVGRSAARNWVEFLAADRPTQVTFGAYATASRGETRNQGFAEDWALSGAVATGVDAASGTTFAEQLAGIPAQGLPGLLTQTTADSGSAVRGVAVVTILIGANDYAGALTEYANSLSADDEFAARRNGVDAVNAGIEATVRSSVAAIRAANPQARIVVATPPDITIAPLVRSALAAGSGIFPGLTATVTRSVTALNADLARFARGRNVGLVDTQAVFARYAAKPTIDGVTVNLRASGQNLSDGFIGDGFHPGTIVQGVLARAIVARIDAMSGSAVIAPITSNEIVDFARASEPAVQFNAAADASTAAGVTLRAVVTPGASTTPTPTGAVTFESIIPATATAPAEVGTVLGTTTLDAAGTATLTVDPAALATGSIFAVYAGDEFNEARISSPLVPTTPASPVATETAVIPTITGTGNQRQVRLDVAVAPADASDAVAIAGAVSLRIAGRAPVALAVVAGQASATFPLAAVRGRQVQAVFGGSASLGSSRSPSFPVEA